MHTLDPHSLAKAALVKMAQQNINPSLYIQAAANSGNPGMQKVASAIIRYDQAQQRTKQAFVQGVVAELANRNVDLNTFANAAFSTSDPGLQKTASDIMHYAGAVSASQALEKVASGRLRGLKNLAGKFPGVRNIREGYRKGKELTKNPVGATDLARGDILEGINAANRQIAVGAGQAAAATGVSGLAGYGGYSALTRNRRPAEPDPPRYTPWRR